VHTDPSSTRATVYFDASLHRGLRLEAIETDRSVSDLVDEAIRLTQAEDADDRLTEREREREPALSFADVVKDMRRCGKV
jgi:hypothetical protein